MECFHFELGHENRKLLCEKGSREKIERELLAAVREELTPKQRETVILYYGKKMTMPQIAKKQHVCVSTVSRSIMRARARIDRRMCRIMKAMQKRQI